MAAPIAASVGLLFLYMAVTLQEIECLQRLGKHSKPVGSSKVLFGLFPQPSDFFELFVKPGVPLLMKSVLEETDNPAFEKWDDDYLRDVYGDVMVHIERDKKENRTLAGGNIKLSQYIGVYSKKNMNIYLVQSLPKVMKDEVLVPFTLSCGGFQSSLQDAVIWYSNGGTKSVLHYDDSDNILCLLDGSKKLVLIDKQYRELIERDGFVPRGAYSKVNVDGVDPVKFPGIMEAPWREISLNKGDCVYIPYRWYHHVYSHTGRNLAVNLWFTHRWSFNKSDCVDVKRSDPMKSFNQYTQASPNQPIWASFLSPFADIDTISRSQFIQACHCSDEEANQVWSKMKSDGNETVTWSEVYSVDVDDLIQTFPNCFYIADTGEEGDEQNSLHSRSETNGINIEPADEIPLQGKVDSETILDVNVPVESQEDDIHNNEVDKEDPSEVAYDTTSDVEEIYKAQDSVDHQVVHSDEHSDILPVHENSDQGTSYSERTQTNLKGSSNDVHERSPHDEF